MFAFGKKGVFLHGRTNLNQYMSMNNNDRNMLPIGTLLKQGEYRVERYIASGGFGNTYEVVHTRLPKRFAVKEFFMRGINQREGAQVSVSRGGDFMRVE